MNTATHYGLAALTLALTGCASIKTVANVHARVSGRWAGPWSALDLKPKTASIAVSQLGDQN